MRDFIGPTDQAREAEQGGWLSEDAKANLAFAPFPTGPGGQYTFVGGSNLAILKIFKHQDAALKWVNFLLSYDSQLRYGQAIGTLPATLAGRSDPAVGNDPLYSTLSKIALMGKTAPPIAI